jgi:hypothetical protein
VTASDLSRHLDDIIEQASAMRATLKSGGLPMLADARILRGQAQCAERLMEVVYIKELRSMPERTAEQDRESQRFLVAKRVG